MYFILGFQHIADNFDNRALQVWCRYHAFAKCVHKVRQHGYDADNFDGPIGTGALANDVIKLFYVHSMPDEADNNASSFYAEMIKQNDAKFKSSFKQHFEVSLKLQMQ